MTFRRGVTLLELLVALMLLSVLLGVSGVAVASLKAPRASARVRQIEAAHAAAIRTGQPVSVVVDSSAYRFLPDGRGVGPGVDPVTGAIGATR